MQRVRKRDVGKETDKDRKEGGDERNRGTKADRVSRGGTEDGLWF